MKIAIIGGGASGMISAYLLDQQGHKVTLYEKQTALGGHIRTLNQNASPQTVCSERLEMGVLEFSAEFTNFRRLMEELNVPLEPVEIGSGLFFRGGRHFLSSVMINNNFQGAQKWRELRFCCKKLASREFSYRCIPYYTATPKILLMKEICPMTSPLSIPLIWPLRIMFIDSYPLRVRLAVLNEPNPRPGLVRLFIKR